MFVSPSKRYVTAVGNKAASGQVMHALVTILDKIKINLYRSVLVILPLYIFVFHRRGVDSTIDSIGS
jgi:hypothetical protein